MKEIVLLFDMDNVLLTPGGYRMAIRDSMKYHLNEGKVSDRIPLESLPEIFESVGVTNEWDMMAITLSILCDKVLEKQTQPIELQSVEECAKWLAKQPLEGVQVDYREEVLKIVNYASPGEPVAFSLYRAARKEENNHLFSFLKQHETLLKNILACTPDVYQSSLTRVFQNLILGSERFEAAYGLPAEVQTGSYLEIYDHTNLSEDWLHWILAKHKSGFLRPVLFTARPSLPPNGAIISDRHFSPEAEAGARVVNLELLPLVGMGRADYIASINGKNMEELLKPNAFHAAASIFRAFIKDEMAALDAAYRLCFEKKLEKIDGLNMADIEVHVFEDSPGGVRAAREAVQILKNAGLSIDLFIWGIADHKDKIASLEKLGGIVSEEINCALGKFQQRLEIYGND